MSERTASRALALAAVVGVVLAGCSHPVEAGSPQAGGREGADSAATAFASDLRQRVTTDRMFAHLAELQAVADAHGRNRAVGSAGYEASVDYVAQQLRDSGFDVQTPEFELRMYKSEKPVLTVGDTQIDATPLKYSAGTAGVRGPLVAAPAEDTPGCTPADYDGLPVRGSVVLVDRGSCRFAEKLSVAAQLGAVAVIVADNVDEDTMPASLMEDNTVTVPMVGVSKSIGAQLRADPAPASLRLDATTASVKFRNVVAQTRSGSSQDVVMVGAHLDSVPEGPGVNDNGSGVAAVLETARQLGSTPAVRNAVRFGFWGAEEVGLVGSRRYVESLNPDQLKDIALYLNFDMLASPNAGYFTYDGDQSTPPGRGEDPPPVPEGSAGIERTLVAYLKTAGKQAQDTSFDGRSDYEAFTLAGIPAGGLYAGAEEKKTAEQAALWGGEADVPFDPDYHTGTDTLDQINREALGIQGGGVAYTVGLYAQQIDGRNGLPVREDRTRHVLTPQ